MILPRDGLVFDQGEPVAFASSPGKRRTFGGRCGTSLTYERDDLDIIRGSGNVFRDVGHANADAEQLKSILAAQIIAAMDAEQLTTRKAEDRTGIAAADFSRIRRAKLDRFTIDRLMAVLNRLDRKVEVSVSVGPRSGAAHHSA